MPFRPAIMNMRSGEDQEARGVGVAKYVQAFLPRFR